MNDHLGNWKLVICTVAAVTLSTFTNSVAAQSVSFLTAVDDSLNFYISTNDSVLGTFVGSQVFGEAVTLTGALTPGVTNYLHIDALNTIGNGALVGEFTLSGNSFSFVGGGLFLQTKPSTVNASITGFGSNYVTPYSYGTVTQIGSGGPFTQPNSTEAIWGQTAADPHVYFSIPVIAAVPEPETYAMLLAGLGLIGAISRRRTAKSIV